MKRLIRQTAVIARRDFVATVATPTFLLFLMAPFFMLAFALVGGIGASQVTRGAQIHAEIVALVPAGDGAKLMAADRALRTIYQPGEAPPSLRIVAPGADAEAQARALFRHNEVLTRAVLLGPLDRLPTRLDRRCVDRTVQGSPMCPPPPDRRMHVPTATERRRRVQLPGSPPRRSTARIVAARGTITRVIRPAWRGRPRRRAAPRSPARRTGCRLRGRSANRHRMDRN